MWVKDKVSIEGKADSKIVRDDFVIAEGPANSFGFLTEDDPKNPFRRRVTAPMLYILKVHRNHPLRVINHPSITQGDYTFIWPIEDSGRNCGRNGRQPADVVKDKMAYDSSAFMLVPFPLQIQSERAQVIPLEKSFTYNLPIVGVKNDASLFYISHGIDVRGEQLRRVSCVMPSHVFGHLVSFVGEPHNVFSYNPEGRGSYNLEGQIDVPKEVRFEVFRGLRTLLQERYGIPAQ